MWIAFLDSSVLFSVFISNLLLFLSEAELFDVRWSRDVHREWMERFVERYPDTDPAALVRKQKRMDQLFPDALVQGYEPLIVDFNLDDPGDNHVVAAAYLARANVLSPRILVISHHKCFPMIYWRRPQTILSLTKSI